MWRSNPRSCPGVICDKCNIIIEHEVNLVDMIKFPHPHLCPQCEQKKVEEMLDDSSGEG